MREKVTTLISLQRCSCTYELTLSRKQEALDNARNYGAKQAREGLLISFDDDLILISSVWREILTTEKGSFRMLRVQRLQVKHPLASWAGKHN